jgi:hypothetical protein
MNSQKLRHFCNRQYFPPLCKAAVLSEESRLTVKEVASMRRILLVLTVALVMAAMMVAMAMSAFAAPKFGSPGEAGHPTCTKAEPDSPAIEPIGGGECSVSPREVEVSPSNVEH